MVVIRGVKVFDVSLGEIITHLTAIFHNTNYGFKLGLMYCGKMLRPKIMYVVVAIGVVDCNLKSRYQLS